MDNYRPPLRSQHPTLLVFNIFLSTIPTVGPGKLRHREDTKLYGTDNEKNLFGPQDPFYLKLGNEFALAGVGVNVFFFPSQYIDVASIGYMAAQSGGQVFFHPRNLLLHAAEGFKGPARVGARHGGVQGLLRLGAALSGDEQLALALGLADFGV